MDGRRTTEVNVTGTRRRVSGLPLALVLAPLLALALLVTFLLVGRSEAPPAGSATASPTATTTATGTARPTATAAGAATTAPASPAATGVAGGVCANRYIAGDEPIVAPRKSGQHLEVALDAIYGGQGGNNRWAVRFHVPTGAPGSAVVPLSAAVTGPSGPLTMGRYEYGPPNAGTAPRTEPVTIAPCDAASPPGVRRGTILVVVESSPVRSGTYTLTWRDIRLPEGRTRDETWTVTLTCEPDPGPGGAYRCR